MASSAVHSNGRDGTREKGWGRVAPGGGAIPAVRYLGKIPRYIPAVRLTVGFQVGIPHLPASFGVYPSCNIDGASFGWSRQGLANTCRICDRQNAMHFVFHPPTWL
jgi:hypothetical protein